MTKTQRLVGILRALLGLAFLALLAAQLRVLPAGYDDWVRESPELADSGWLLAVAVLELFCVQVVIVCTWRLLTMVADDRIFSDDSFVWVNTIVAALAAAWVVLLVTFLVLAVSGGPPQLSAVTILILMLALVAGAVVGLLMVVMRALLRRATSLRTEMEAVV